MSECPSCEKPVPTAADPAWRPFCSQRCQQADLGQWFAGTYAIAEAPDAEFPTVQSGEA